MYSVVNVRRGYQLDGDVCRSCSYSPALMWGLVVLLAIAIGGYVALNVVLSMKKTSIAAGPLKVLLKQLINNFQTVKRSMSPPEGSASLNLMLHFVTAPTASDCHSQKRPSVAPRDRRCRYSRQFSLSGCGGE